MKSKLPASPSERAAVSPDDWRALAFEHTPSGLAIVVEGGRIVQANPAFAALTGWAGAQIEGRGWSEVLVQPASGEVEGAPGRKLVRARRRPGLWFELDRRPLAAGRTLYTLRETTSERRESERRLSKMLQTFPGVAYRCRNDRRWTMEFVSQGILALTGYEPAAFISDEISLTELTHPDDAVVLWEQVQQALRDRQQFGVAYRLRTHLGQEKWCWEQGEGVYDEDGTLVALEGYILDVTEEFRARQALQDSREHLSRLLDSLGDGVVATDARDRVTLLNPVAEALTGYAEAEALGRPLAEVVRLSSVAGGELGQAGLGGQRGSLTDAQGRVRTIAHTSAPILDAEGLEVGQVLVLRDISERVAIEEELRQAQKMEAVGRLAGGIAHDFNNLLTGIMGYADLLQGELADQEPLGQFAQVILETSHRAAELTSELLAFSRRRPLARRPLDMHAVIESAIALVRSATDPRVVIETHFDAPFTTVSGDRAALQSALLNIALNARDAMPEGGTLRFATELREIDARQAASLPTIEPGCYLRIEISDTGPGIPEAELERIFEPFYTSKEIGEGTGLGLAAVYGTVTGHGGAVRALNRPEGGASFICLLPLAVSEAEEASGAGGAGEIVHGRGLVLLGEDEAVVRRLLAGMLTQLGYTVVKARDGREVVSLFEARPADFSLVLLDLRMPRMSGQQAIEILIERRPEVRILVSSGMDLSDRFPPQVRGTLPKPFTLAELSRSVADALA